MAYFYLLVAICSEVIATSSMKLSDGFTRLGPSLVTVCGYAAAFYFLSLTLRTMPTGVAYAIWSGLGVVLITLIAWLLNGERLAPGVLFGMALIVGGVIVINLSARAHGP